MRQHLTDLNVRNFKPHPARPQITIWDTTLKGFGCRISSSGTKSWVVMRGRDRRLSTLGRYPDMPLKDARIAAKAQQGKPPKPASVRFWQAVDTFIANVETRTRSRTSTGYRRYFDRHLMPTLRHKLICDIVTDDIMAVIDGLTRRLSNACIFSTRPKRSCVSVRKGAGRLTARSKECLRPDASTCVTAFSIRTS